MQTAQDPAGGTAAPGAPGGTPAPGIGHNQPPSRLGNGGGAPAVGLANGGVGDGGDDDLDTGGAPAWGDNWREGLSKGDEARLKRLERYATPDAVADALFAAQDRLRRGGQVPVLADDATDIEIAAFRKAHGIPEKASDYGLAWPEGVTPTDADKAALGTFAEFMHARHIPPSGVKAAFEWYTQAQAAGAKAIAEAVHELQLENVAQLRQEFPGREFKRNLAIAEEYLAKYFEGDEEALDQVLQATMKNGLPVKDYAPFIKGLVRMGRAGADEEAIVGGDGGGGGKTIDTEYKELIAKSATARLSNEEHNRLLELSEARQRREEKQGRRTQAA